MCPKSQISNDIKKIYNYSSRYRMYVLYVCMYVFVQQNLATFVRKKNWDEMFQMDDCGKIKLGKKKKISFEWIVKFEHFISVL